MSPARWARALVRALGGVSSPTADIYFAEPLRELIGRPGRLSRRPIARISPTVFAAGRQVAILRYADRRALAAIDRLAPDRVHYLIDDNLYAIDEASGLPSDYRARLARFRDGMLPEILARASDVIAPSREILACYPDHRTAHLDPAALVPPASLDHFDAADGVRIVFSGTRSHVDDLGAIVDPLAALLREKGSWSLTTFLGRHAPAALASLPNARHLDPMSWPRYRRALRTKRFHIALAPAEATLFNRSRSLSRLFDHAAFGAAALYADQPPFAGVVRDGVEGRLLSPSPSAWHDAVAALGRDLEAARGLAEGGASLSRTIGDQDRVRRFWLERFGLEAPRHASG